jgi:hypothetical protein
VLRVRVGRQSSAKLQSESEGTSRALWLRIEDEWSAGRIRGETPSTEQLLDETFKGITSVGVPQSKADLVRSIASSGASFTEGDHTERDIRIHGGIAISTGLVTVRSSGPQHCFHHIFVFQGSNGEWPLIAAQATRMGKS